MDTTTVAIIVAVVAAAVLAAAAALYFQWSRNRGHRLQETFGPEYDRTVRTMGSRRAAEHELEQREKRVQEFQLEELTAEMAQTFAVEWEQVQAEFVDNPRMAIERANSMIMRAMQARGYPLTEFETRTADISVNYPQTVQRYRAAHEIADKSARGKATTEELRQAMVHYRALFEDLIGTPQAAAGS